MAKILSLRQARIAALRGDVEPALESLSRLCSSDNDDACLSLIELLAFRWMWSECITLLVKYLDRDRLGSCTNICIDNALLLCRAGLMTGEWSLMKEMSEKAIQTRVVKANTIGYELSTDPQYMWLEKLAYFAEQQGNTPQPFILFPLQTFPVSREQYLDAVEQIPVLRPDLLKNARAMARHRFALAEWFKQDEDAIEEYFKDPASMSFEQALHTARLLLQRDKHELAWTVVIEKIPDWWPIDVVQVAPTELLWHPDLFKLMTPERCEQVLRTPRGPLAV